jgi:hypothetical protein
MWLLYVLLGLTKLAQLDRELKEDEKRRKKEQKEKEKEGK